jgi:hypothetical protein
VRTSRQAAAKVAREGVLALLRDEPTVDRLRRVIGELKLQDELSGRRRQATAAAGGLGQAIVFVGSRRGVGATTTAVNLGLMVASPADLVGGRQLAPADGKPAAAAVDRYLDEKVTPLPAEASLGPIQGGSGGGAPPGGSAGGAGP